MFKLTVVHVMFASAGFLLSQRAEAAVVEVDVTIKSVDAKARGITVVYKTDLGEKTIELDVSRKAEITVNGKEGTLDSLGRGLKGKVSYDKDLAIVTKIEAKGTPVATKQPELVQVSELNDEGDNEWPSLAVEAGEVEDDRRDNDHHHERQKDHRLEMLPGHRASLATRLEINHQRYNNCSRWLKARQPPSP